MNDAFRVLIVDDGRQPWGDLSEILTGCGCLVESLSGPDDPIPAVRSLLPDLVLLDIAPPCAAGLEILHRLETARSLRYLPVIVLSGQAELEYELLDVFDFLGKPLDEKRLKEDVELLRSGRLSARQGPYPPMTVEDRAPFQDYLVHHSGLHFDQRNAKILERGLMRRMRAVGCLDYGDYFDYLSRHALNRQELNKLLGLLTVGETYFFRYAAHFKALISSVLPELISRKKSEKTLNIWSAGCSTGEEPYSLAMLLREEFSEFGDWEVNILATDINQKALKAARDGVYRQRALRVTEPRYRNRYFRQSGSSYLLDPSVRKSVRFAYMNFQTGDFPSRRNGTSDIDVIFCRNVMIYFRLATTRRIVEKFHDCLSPGGYLFLGHSETLTNISERFKSVQREGGFFYRRPLTETHGAALEERPAPRTMPVPRTIPAPPAPQLIPAPPAKMEEFDVEGAYREGLEALDREDFASGSERFALVLRHRQDHAGALVGKGFILANGGDFDAALDLCRLALEKDDLFPDAYFLRGIVFEACQEQPEAVGEYHKALLLEPAFIMAHYNLSKLFLRAGKPADARRELNNTLRLLELSSGEEVVPHSGGLSRSVLFELCREDAARLEVLRQKEGRGRG